MLLSVHWYLFTIKKGVDGYYCILGKTSQQDEVLPPSIDIYLELHLERAPRGNCCEGVQSWWRRNTPVESFAIQPTEVPQHQPLPPVIACLMMTEA
jgi:hypothetical protein